MSSASNEKSTDGTGSSDDASTRSETEVEEDLYRGGETEATDVDEVGEADLLEAEEDLPEPWEYGAERRDAYWAQYGEVSPMAYFGPTNGLMSPWPGKAENFVPVWLPDSTVITTSGLSSPWSEEGGDPGEGLELYIDSPRLAGIALEDIATTWELALLVLVASHQAGQDYRPTYDRYGCLVLSGITDTGIPEDWLDEDGGLGVLLGACAGTRPDYIEMFGDASAVRLIAVTPLRPSELAEVRRSGRYREAGEVLTASPYRNQVHLDRPVLFDHL